MTPIYENLICSFIKQSTKEDALLFLLDFLKEHIPFETILCHKVDRKTKIFTTFIEYSHSGKISEYSFKLDKLLTISTLNSLFKNAASKIVIKDLDDSQELFEFYQQFPIQVQSVIFLPFYIEQDFKVNMFFTCFSSQKNAFNEKHKEILEFIRPYLENILCELYLHNPEPQIFINSNISLPSSSEGQLRQCPNLNEVMKKIEIIAPHDTTVLINGPTGSGKELVATTLHTLSPRNKKPFIPVNCSAIPENLVESELFGFEKGAFTGASYSKKGYFEQANFGTLFLDEVADLSPITQTRLLRVLETRQVQRIGSEKLISLDVRIITATHKNLEKLVEKNEFREDLYYRLKGITIKVPPLKERKKDIKVLIEYFYSQAVRKFNLSPPPTLSYKTLRALMDYSWPGNVRQLKMSIEEALFEALIQDKKEIFFPFLQILPIHNKRQKLSQSEILEALEKTNWKIQGKNSASELLNVNHSTLRSRMRTLEIPFKRQEKQS